LTGIADSPFEWFWAYLGGKDFNRTVIAVQEAVNSQYFPWYCWSANCLAFDIVETILSCYMNGVLKNQIPEYLAGSDWDQLTATGKKCVPFVVTCSGAGTDLVSWCLYQLAVLTQAGSVTDTTLRPNSSQNPDRDPPTKGDWTVLDVLKWILILGGIAVAAYGIGKVTGFIHSVDEAVTDDSSTD
jgi:hypothetical protein